MNQQKEKQIEEVTRAAMLDSMWDVATNGTPYQTIDFGNGYAIELYSQD